MPEIKIVPLSLNIFRETDRVIYRQRLLDKTRGDNGIEFPKEGGILAYFVGEKYPVKGMMLLADETILDVVDRVKAGFLRALRFTFTKPVVFFLPLMLPFYKPILKSALIQLADFTDKTLRNFYLKDDKWCKSGREIWRVLSKKVKEKYQIQLIRALLMVWEWSDSYRYKGQDLAGELNKEALKENPRKELLRLMDLLIERERHEGMKQKWGQFRKPIILLMWIFRGKVKIVAEILMEMDLEKIRLDEADWYHCLIRSYYDFKGISFVKRMEKRQKIDNN